MTLPHNNLPQLIRMLAAFAALTLASGSYSFCTAALGESVEFLPVDHVRSGMVGIGKTVLSKTSIDTFDVEILGVEKNARLPGRSLILARLRGAGLEDTGVIRGMSGSPVYIDGRLVGAVSFGWSFSKKPICGITPIAEMLAVMERNQGDVDASGERPGGLSWPTGAAAGLEPLGSPITLSGFSASAAGLFSEFAADYGLHAVASPGGGESSAARELGAPSLEPGAALGVQLIGGDLRATAIGTLTHVDGDRLVGFGHALFGFGAVDMPLTRAYIYDVLPSQFISFKLGTGGDVVGALRQDRWAGIAGRAGATASVLPITVEVGDGAPYEMTVLRHPSLTPFLTQVLLVSVFESAERVSGEATVSTRGTVFLDDGTRIERADVYAGRKAIRDAARELAEPLGLVMDRFKATAVDSLHFALAVRDESARAEISELRVDQIVASGETLEVRVLLRPLRGRSPVERTLRLPVPRHALPGPVQVRVGSGRAAEAWEFARRPDAFNPRDPQQLVALLQRPHRSDDLVVELYRSETGLSVDGRELPGLPPSARFVMDEPQASGRVAAVSGRVLSRRRQRTDFMLTGEQQADVIIRARND